MSTEWTADQVGLAAWEDEVLARHRWGKRPWLTEHPWPDQKAEEERKRLKKFQDTTGPWDDDSRALLDQILVLEICNWRLEESILALAEAIGKKKPTDMKIGHMASMTGERWRKIWSYYLTLRDWNSCKPRSGYDELLALCDTDGTVRNHVLGMLGEPTELKGLYVERFCLMMDYWLNGCPEGVTPAQSEWERSLEREIAKRDPEGKILEALREEGAGKLEFCHHKLFRRYDIILSSIGASKWRGRIPARGTDGLDRADELERYLEPIDDWVEGRSREKESRAPDLYKRIQRSLGKRDDNKVFMASLLVSLLRAQGLAARALADSRAKHHR
jgi:hypothetical protein